MIVVDTSALVSILRSEADSEQMLQAVCSASRTVIGTPTKFELLLVMGRWQAEPGVAMANQLLEDLSIETLDFTDALAIIAVSAFLRFGKGRHPAALNYGDCMAYAVAKSLNAPLLFKGQDFAATDLHAAV